jgi:glucose/arabinose dehydrogenase
MSRYVDNHPPEEFTRVRPGGNYGWPFCNPNPDTANGLDNMPFDRDVQLNADGRVDCSAMDRINKGIQAHSAPLGLTFLQGTAFPALYRDGVVTGLHGSWNRTTPTGYKVAYFPWDSTTQRPGAQIDLVTGWLTSQGAWGRPVDAAVDLQGNLLISDDGSGTIYKLTYTQSSTPPVTPPIPTATPPMPPVIRSVVRLPLIFHGNRNGVPVPPTQP